MPTWLYDAVQARKEAAKALQIKLDKTLASVQKRLADITPKLSFSVEAARQDRALQKEMQRTVPNAMAVQPTMSDDERKHVEENYSKNVALSIQGFVDSEVQRFRDKVIPKIQAGMDRRELRDYVQGRLGVTKDRAKFIARQETSLYISNLKEAGYRDAGIEKYRWKAIGGNRGDGRTRDDHMDAHGKEFFWDHQKNLADPKIRPFIVYQDDVPQHPGTAFNCRCVAIPIVEEL
jgi:SPP1 gp7 family putative phage head morphogenesis protein